MGRYRYTFILTGRRARFNLCRLDPVAKLVEQDDAAAVGVHLKKNQKTKESQMGVAAVGAHL